MELVVKQPNTKDYQKTSYQGNPVRIVSTTGSNQMSFGIDYNHLGRIASELLLDGQLGRIYNNLQLTARANLPTSKYDDVEIYVDDLTNEIRKLLSDNNLSIEDIAGIGIGAPNGNFYTGSIDYAPNLKFKGRILLKEMMETRLHTHVELTNDANAAAIGEMTYGAGKGMRDFIEITLGTGVGSGIVINGELVYGHDGFAGELGHVIVVPDGRQCGCGFKGCLEAYCSATGVARTAREILAKSDAPSLLREKNPEEIESLDVAIAAGKGDKIANEIFEFTGEILGKAMADFTKFSSPEAYIFFGGLTKAGDLIMNPIKKAYDENCLPIFRGKAKVLVSELPDSDAAVLGASALGWE